MPAPAGPAVAAGLVALAPYALEAADLLASWISAMAMGDDELTPEKLEELKAKFIASGQRADAAIAALDDAIAAKRAEQGSA